jgi:hypothetical protein
MRLSDLNLNQLFDIVCRRQRSELCWIDSRPTKNKDPVKELAFMVRGFKVQRGSRFDRKSPKSSTAGRACMRLSLGLLFVFVGASVFEF